MSFPIHLRINRVNHRCTGEVTIQGKLVYLPTLNGFGGEAPPGGFAVQVGGRTIFLRNVSEAALNALTNQDVIIRGTVVTGTWGGIETPGGTYEMIDRPVVEPKTAGPR